MPFRLKADIQDLEVTPLLPLTMRLLLAPFLIFLTLGASPVNSTPSQVRRWVGEWVRDENASISIKARGAQLYISGYADWYPPRQHPPDGTPNYAIFEGAALPHRTTIRVVDRSSGAEDGCQVELSLHAGRLVARDQADCGGANVTFNGTYHRKPSDADQVTPDCGGNTLEMNACLQDQLGRSEETLRKYVRRAVELHSKPVETLKPVGPLIESAERAFEAYRKTECAAVYAEWQPYSIRDVMTLSCELQLTDQRTHEVWENWLREEDAAPVLPEPTATK